MENQLNHRRVAYLLARRKQRGLQQLKRASKTMTCEKLSLPRTPDTSAPDSSVRFPVWQHLILASAFRGRSGIALTTSPYWEQRGHSFLAIPLAALRSCQHHLNLLRRKLHQQLELRYHAKQASLTPPHQAIVALIEDYVRLHGCAHLFAQLCGSRY